ncbi:hypothetical protein GEMRC1_012854 [Eukaryota sp. GEM-RC1]
MRLAYLLLFATLALVSIAYGSESNRLHVKGLTELSGVTLGSTTQCGVGGLGPVDIKSTLTLICYRLTLVEDSIWSGGHIYLGTNSSLTVPENVTLDVTKTSNWYFHNGGGTASVLRVDGTLILSGSSITRTNIPLEVGPSGRILVQHSSSTFEIRDGGNIYGQIDVNSMFRVYTSTLYFYGNLTGPGAVEWYVSSFFHGTYDLSASGSTIVSGSTTELRLVGADYHVQWIDDSLVQPCATFVSFGSLVTLESSGTLNLTNHNVTISALTITSGTLEVYGDVYVNNLDARHGTINNAGRLTTVVQSSLGLNGHTITFRLRGIYDFNGTNTFIGGTLSLNAGTHLNFYGASTVTTSAPTFSGDGAMVFHSSSTLLLSLLTTVNCFIYNYGHITASVTNSILGRGAIYGTVTVNNGLILRCGIASNWLTFEQGSVLKQSGSATLHSMAGDVMLRGVVEMDKIGANGGILHLFSGDYVVDDSGFSFVPAVQLDVLLNIECMSGAIDIHDHNLAIHDLTFPNTNGCIFRGTGGTVSVDNELDWEGGTLGPGINLVLENTCTSSVTASSTVVHDCSIVNHGTFTVSNTFTVNSNSHFFSIILEV